MSSEMLPFLSASASGQPSISEGSSPLTLRKLRPYQREVALAIVDSVFGRKGLTFSVEIARQGGKNELSAQLELLLLTLYMGESQNLVKYSFRLMSRLTWWGIRRIFSWKLMNRRMSARRSTPRNSSPWEQPPT